jgi:predicted secreted protein
MGIVPGIVTFLIIWWVVLFAVLPLGVRGQWEEGDVTPGSEPGAPTKPDLGRKALITTAVAAAIWLVVFVLISVGVFSFDDLTAPWSPNAG